MTDTEVDRWLGTYPCQAKRARFVAPPARESETARVFLPILFAVVAVNTAAASANFGLNPTTGMLPRLTQQRFAPSLEMVSDLDATVHVR